MSHAPDHDDGSGAAAPLDLLLTDATQHPLRRFLPGISGARFAARLATHPRSVAARGRHLAAELGRIGAGRSTAGAHAKDRRFADEAWASNAVLRRTLQTYLALGEAARGLVDDADLGLGGQEARELPRRQRRRCLRPSNNPLLNPLVLKEVVDSGGRNLVQGARRLARDLATPPRVPSMVEPDAFEVGRDLGVSAGSVVLRTEMFELIQYAPTTAKVRQVPLLIVPPTINKYYVIDLAPDRSLVEHLVASGQQVYCISWRNPDARHRDWGLDAYGAAVIEAMDAVQTIARQDQVALFALCSGGLLASMVLGHLAAGGDLGRVAAFSLAVTVIDQAQAGMPSALVSRKVAAAATKVSQGRATSTAGCWPRSSPGCAPTT